MFGKVDKGLRAIGMEFVLSNSFIVGAKPGTPSVCYYIFVFVLVFVGAHLQSALRQPERLIFLIIGAPEEATYLAEEILPKTPAAGQCRPL